MANTMLITALTTALDTLPTALIRLLTMVVRLLPATVATLRTISAQLKDSKSVLSRSHWRISGCSSRKAMTICLSRSKKPGSAVARERMVSSRVGTSRPNTAATTRMMATKVRSSAAARRRLCRLMPPSSRSIPRMGTLKIKASAAPTTKGAKIPFRIRRKP